MQTAKNAAATVKETAANVAASAKSGMEKTKATVQEKGERLTAHDPMQKKMATEKKEQRLHQAEYEKMEAREMNAAQKHAEAAPTGTHRVTGHSTGMHLKSALPGHGTGHPTGHVTDGVVGSHPIGTATGTGGHHNTKIGGGTNTGYGTGGAFR